MSRERWPDITDATRDAANALIDSAFDDGYAAGYRAAADRAHALWQNEAAARRKDGNPSMAVAIAEASIRILCDADEQLAKFREGRS